MKPVEIEFLMKDGLSKGVDKSRAGIEQLLDASRRLGEVLSQSGEEGARASDKYNSKLVGLRQGVEKMSASLKAMGVSEKETAGVLMKSSEQNVKFVEAQTTRLRTLEDNLRSALESGNTALAESTKTEIEQVETWMNEALNAIQKNAELIPTIVKNAASTVPTKQTESMRQQLRQLTNEIASATVEYRRMTDAERNSATGMELKRKLEDLIKKAGELRDAMDDVNSSVRGEASDTKHLDGIAQGLNVLTSSAGAATSVFQMFGAKQEDLINIQTKLQATLAISNALTVIQNNLQKESSLMLGIRTIQEKAHAAAIALRTAAEGRGVIVTKLATIAQAAFNAVANANPYVLLATAILTVVGALVAFTTGSKEATEAEKRQREEGERLRKQQEDMSHALGQAVGNVEAKYRSLQQQWSRLKTESEKNKWIKDNANKFHELGLNVNSVTDAEQVLVDMAPQVIAALKAVAEAEAYSDLYKQAIQKRAIEWEHRIKSRDTGDFYTTASQGQKFGHSYAGQGGTFSGAVTGFSKEEYDRMMSDPRFYTSESEFALEGSNRALKLTVAGAAEINRMRNAAALNLQRQKQSRYDEEVNFYGDKWDEAERKAAEARSQIPAHLRYNGGGSGGSSGSGRNGKGGNGGDNDLKDEENRAEALTELQAKNRQEEINQMAEGAEKKRAQLRLDYDKEITELAALEKEWRTAQKGELTQDQADALEAARKLAKSKFEAGEAEIAEEEAEQERVRRKAQLQSMRQYLKEYGDELQQELAITEDYKEQIAEARAKGDEGKALLLERKFQEELNNKRLTNLRNSPEYIRAFEDLGNTSTQTLQSLIKKFEEAKDAAAKSLDPHQLREYTETLQQMYDELDSRNPFDALTKALKELADAQKEVKDAQDIYDKVRGGHAVINASTGNAYTESEASRLLTAAKDKEAKAYARLSKASADCGKRLNQFADTLNQLGDMVGGKLGDSLGALGNILGSVGGAFENIKNINVNATGFEKALGQFSAVASTVSAMVDMNLALDKLLPDAESLYEHYAAKQRELNEKRMRMIELEIEQLEQRLTSESWFYENGLTQLKKNAELNAQYAKAYGEVAAMPQEIYRNASSGFSKWAPAIIGAIIGIVAGILTFGAGAGPGAALGAALGSAIGGTAIGAALGATVVAAIGTAIFSGVGAALGNAVRAGIDGLTYKEGQTAAINNMRVQTRHKTFFRSEKTQDLQSWVKENWGQDLFEEVKGVQLIDPEVAKKILEKGPTLVGETRETLEQLLEYSEKIREFIDEVHEYVSEAFSPLVDNLTDALWDWLSNGEDVMDKFREYAADTFKNIAQDALKAMITKNIFEPFQEQLEDLTIAYSTGQIDETAYMAAVAEFAKQASAAIEAQLPVLQNAAQVMEMAMEGAGIDIVGNDTVQQSGKAGAFTTMSQDQAGKLEGLFVNGQMHWASMDDRLEDVASRMSSVQDHLRQIATNTGSSAQSLGEIKEDIKKMIRDGLKMK